MSALFDRAFDLVVGAEGGYNDVPEDPGGETNFGISRRSYPNEDIKGMTRERAKDIYYNDYWLPLHPFELPDQVAILLFDMAVNMGRHNAICCLQSAAEVKVDGNLGPVSRAALKARNGPGLYREITARRIIYYTGLGTFKFFGLGWIRRSLKLLGVL